MGKGGKKETKEVDQTTQQQSTTQLDPNSRRFVEQFLRPLGIQGAGAALGTEGSFFADPTQTFTQGRDIIAGLETDLGSAREDLDLAREGIQGAGDFSFSPGRVSQDRIRAFLDPFQEEVVGGVQQNFDRQRQQALNAAAQQATASGAFGGSRDAILRAQGLRDVNLDETRQISQLRSQGFNQALQAALGEFNTRQRVGLEAARARQQGALQEAGLGLDAARTGANLGLGQARLGLQQGQALTDIGELERQIQQAASREPLFRAQQALQFANQGLGPTGQVSQGSTSTQGTTTIEQDGGGFFGQVLPNLIGLGATLGGAGLFGGVGGGGSGGGGGGSGFGKGGG